MDADAKKNSKILQYYFFHVLVPQAKQFSKVDSPVQDCDQSKGSLVIPEWQVELRQLYNCITMKDAKR